MFFSYIIINDLNGLPNSVGKVYTINTFPSLLEDHWKDADFNFKGQVYVQETNMCKVQLYLFIIFYFCISMISCMIYY